MKLINKFNEQNNSSYASGNTIGNHTTAATNKRFTNDGSAMNFSNSRQISNNMLVTIAEEEAEVTMTRNRASTRKEKDKRGAHMSESFDNLIRQDLGQTNDNHNSFHYDQSADLAISDNSGLQQRMNQQIKGLKTSCFSNSSINNDESDRLNQEDEGFDLELTQDNNNKNEKNNNNLNSTELFCTL